MRIELSSAILAVCSILSLPVFGEEPQLASHPVKVLTKQPELYGKMLSETTPIMFHGRHLLVQCTPWDGPRPTPDRLEILVRDPATGEEIARFAKGYGLANAFVEGDTLHVFAAKCVGCKGDAMTPDDWFQNIYHFTSTDLKTWKPEGVAIPRSGNEHVLNSTVCRDDTGYLMIYDTDLPVQFCFKFARSTDLTKWDKIDGLVFAGVGGKEYSGCPVIRRCKPYYYVIYLHAAIPGLNGWVGFMARSKDLMTWELSPKNPVLEATEDEGINNSDFDMIEIDGKTYVYYCTGNQATWADVKRAVYPGPMHEFFESYFPEGAAMTTVDTRVETHK